MAPTQGHHIVVVGGGTGTYTVLRGLKRYCPKVRLTAVVSMADNGGSTGRLRDEFGYLPAGDVRMALVALASERDKNELLMRRLFLHRFEKGNGLSGHNVGNLLLTALTDMLKGEPEAIEAASRILRVEGTVVPVTTDNVQLVATYRNGVVVTGEHDIDEPDRRATRGPITSLTLTPRATLNPRARRAIESADLLVFGPGDLYTSILANCVVEGFGDAVCRTGATIACVVNLMTKRGQTEGMSVADHIDELSRYLGRRPHVALANTGTLPEALRRRYAKENEYPVEGDLPHHDNTLIMRDFLARRRVTLASGDVLKRSLVRHSSQKLARALIELL